LHFILSSSVREHSRTALPTDGKESKYARNFAFRPRIRTIRKGVHGVSVENALAKARHASVGRSTDIPAA
jgi:hypothetical protein